MIAAGTADMTLLLVFGVSGRAATLRVLESDLPEAGTQEIWRGALASVRNQSPAPPWGVRIQIAASANPTFTLGRVSACPADLDIISLQGPRRESRIANRPLVRSAFTGLGVFRVTLGINAEGRVRNVTLLEGSGDAFRDQIILEEMQHWRFRPLRIEGIGIATEVDYDQNGLALVARFIQ